AAALAHTIPVTPSPASAAAISEARAPPAIGSRPSMEKVLDQLVEKLRKVHGERLVSVVLYGSGAAGEHDARFSDWNVLGVLSEIPARELGASEPIFRWWRAQGSPSPLLVPERELADSTDCFAIEFHDIHRHHQVLHGKDVISPLTLDDSSYRA